ncbi:hypothetical protein EVAR_42468_1 [Eumeta japonica]|uniref:Uncharacterized protein n=1 Tax=Eumeta variegata TaxID=151549 RepID=A0A4C1Y2A1_EUMVA|nr:hypothetical protein EVAR_42468_1 [Eumeta japonica]
MAATDLSPAGGMGENLKGRDEAEEKLLEDSRVLIVPPRDSAEGGALVVKSSKKVVKTFDINVARCGGAAVGAARTQVYHRRSQRRVAIT